VAAALTTPLDVLKTRIMLDMRVGIYDLLLTSGLIVLPYHRIQRLTNYPRCVSASEISISRKVLLVFLLAPSPERYGSLQVALSSSVSMNGLFTVSWVSDYISLVLDYSIRDRINVGLDIHYKALEIATHRHISGSPYIRFQPPRYSFPI